MYCQFSSLSPISIPVADLRFFRKLCPSICMSVYWSVHWSVYRVWWRACVCALVRRCTPLPNRPQRYCNPALLVIVLHFSLLYRTSCPFECLVLGLRWRHLGSGNRFLTLGLVASNQVGNLGGLSLWWILVLLVFDKYLKDFHQMVALFNWLT